MKKEKDSEDIWSNAERLISRVQYSLIINLNGLPILACEVCAVFQNHPIG